MFGIGMQELLVVLVIALVIFGGKNLPQIGANLGKAIRGFKDAAQESEEDKERRLRGASEPPIKEGELESSAEKQENSAASQKK